MRYNKEVRVRLHGNREAAERYRKRALTLLGQVVRQDIELGRLTQSTRRAVMPDGTIIEVHANNWMPSVDIHVAGQAIAAQRTLVGLLIDFITVTNPYTAARSTQTPHIFDARITAFKDPEDPIGTTVEPGRVRVHLLSGTRPIYSPQYVYGQRPLKLREEVEVLRELPDDPGNVLLPYELVEVVVPLPAGQAVYSYLSYEIAAGWATFHSQGELPRKVVANRRHVFVLLERIFPSEISFTPGGDPSAMTATILLDIYNFNGTRVQRIQLAPSYELTIAGTGPFTVNDDIAAYDKGFYALLKPTPELAGYDIVKWSVEDGFQWSAAALPTGVTDPISIHAGGEGPYIVDRAPNNYPRISWLEFSDGDERGQLTVSESEYPLVIDGFVSYAAAATTDRFYMSIAIEPSGVAIGGTDHRMLIYDLDLQLVNSVDMQDVAQRVGVPLELGYVVPYEDSQLMGAL